MNHISRAELRTPTAFEATAYDFGAEDVRVYQDGHASVTVEVEGLDAVERSELARNFRERSPISMVIDVLPYGPHDVMRETEQDGVPIVVTENGDLFVDGHDITDQYRGRPITEDVLYEVRSRVAEGELPPQRSRDGIRLEDVSSLFGANEPSSASAQSPDEQIDAAKESYVEGEIDMLELEERLYDAYDEKIPTNPY